MGKNELQVLNLLKQFLHSRLLDTRMPRATTRIQRGLMEYLLVGRSSLLVGWEH